MTTVRAEILSQGDEVVLGDIVDTNAAWLSRELTALGFDVSRHSTVGDRLPDLVQLLRDIAGRAEVCLCTGGLGPTCDDLTAEAVSLAFDRPLGMDGIALSQIEDWFRRMQREMPAVNAKQALLPEGAQRLDNLWGTAPGFSVMAGACRFFFMPGVPREMKAMYRQSVRPDLSTRYSLSPLQRIAIRTVGIGESSLQELVSRCDLPAAVSLGFRTSGPQNQVKLTFPADFPSGEAEAIAHMIAGTIGPAVYAITRSGDDERHDLRAVTGQLLMARGLRLFAIETASQGKLAALCGGAPWFAGARVGATNPAHLPYPAPPESAATPGAMARRWAEMIREQEAGDIALLQYGTFDNAQLEDEAVAVELHVVLADANGSTVESRNLSGNLARKRDTAAAFSLDVVRRHLLSRSG